MPYPLETNVMDFAGGDLGARLQAADAALGEASGYLVVPPGLSPADAHVTTPVDFSSDRVVELRSSLTVDTPEFTNGSFLRPLFTMRDRFTLRGLGAVSVQQPRSMIVLAPHDGSLILGDLPGSADFVVENLKICAPANPRPSTGGETAIALGNSVRGRVSNVFFCGTYGIDVTLGGNSNAVNGVSYHCEDVTVEGCTHQFAGDDAIKFAVVNARNWRLVRGLFLGGAGIDVEQNIAQDDCSDWLIDQIIMRGGGGISAQGEGVTLGQISNSVLDGSRVGSLGILLNRVTRVYVRNVAIDGYNGGDASESGGILVSNTQGVVIEDVAVTNCSIISSYSPNPANLAPIKIEGGSVRTHLRNVTVESPLHGWSGVQETPDCVGTVLEGVRLGLGSGTTIVQHGDPVTGTILAASNGLALPQAAIHTAEAQLFDPSGGTVDVLTTAGVQTVTYTGVSGDALVGCSGGTGTMYLGAPPELTVAGAGSRIWQCLVASGDGSTLERISRDPETVSGSFRAHRRVTASTALTVNDCIVGADTSAGAISLTLPNPASCVAPSGAAWSVVIQDEGGAAGHNHVTIKRFGTEKINGAAADKVISVGYGRLTVYLSAGNWCAA